MSIALMISALGALALTSGIALAAALPPGQEGLEHEPARFGMRDHPARR